MEDLKIISEKENPLFNRKEVNAVIKAKSSPKREEITDLLAKKYSTSWENVKIKGVNGSFGSEDFKVEANIYSSKEEKDKTEGTKKKDEEIKKKKEEEKKAAEQPAESGEESQEKEAESTEESSENSGEEKKE